MPKPTEAAGLFGSDLGVKLSPESIAALEAAGGTAFGPAERPMSGYRTIPASKSDAEASEWITEAEAYVATLPPKAPKKKK